MKTQKCRALIVDDEPDAREMIAFLLEEMFPDIEISGKAESIARAHELLKSEEPEIIFLDIELHDGTGFDLLESFSQLSASVIFVSAYDHYAIKAIKASASDYILKPMNRDEFRQAVERVLSKIEKQFYQRNLEEFNVQLRQQGDVHRVGIPTLTGLNLVEVDHIIRCEANGNYTTVYFTNSSRAIVSRTLAHFENELKDHGFMRIHHKHLVNLRQVNTYSKGKGGGMIIMHDKAVLEVSARKKGALLKTISMSS